jgi:SAM-dependent methyltransferase
MLEVVTTGGDDVPPSMESLRLEARHLYGRDAAGYDAGRPQYPDAVYDILVARCGLTRGASVVEIGPGTGLVTRRLVELGARVVAVEPEQALADFLATSVDGSDVTILVERFEDAQLNDGQFDLAVAATSFHWVDFAIGAPKLGRIVRSGGWVAIWWSTLGDPEHPDPFVQTMVEMIGPDPEHPVGGSAFQLGLMGGREDLERMAGLEDVQADVFRWTAPYDPAQLRALYASLSHVRRQSPPDQERLFDALASIARDEFSGAVEHPFVTALYTGRRP